MAICIKSGEAAALFDERIYCEVQVISTCCKLIRNNAITTAVSSVSGHLCLIIYFKVVKRSFSLIWEIKVSFL